MLSTCTTILYSFFIILPVLLSNKQIDVANKSNSSKCMNKTAANKPKNRTTALGIGARRGIEPCAVERSTEARA